jgi:hypothetical protein
MYKKILEGVTKRTEDMDDGDVGVPRPRHGDTETGSKLGVPNKISGSVFQSVYRDKLYIYDYLRISIYVCAETFISTHEDLLLPLLDGRRQTDGS